MSVGTAYKLADCQGLSIYVEPDSAPCLSSDCPIVGWHLPVVAHDNDIKPTTKLVWVKYVFELPEYLRQCAEQSDVTKIDVRVPSLVLADGVDKTKNTPLSRPALPFEETTKKTKKKRVAIVWAYVWAVLKSESFDSFIR